MTQGRTERHEDAGGCGWQGRRPKEVRDPKRQGLTRCVAGSLALAMMAFAHTQQWEIYVANSVMGVGFGLAFSSMSALVVAAVPPEQTGVASGMNANIRTIGGSIGSAVMASIVTSRLQPSGLPEEAGYTTGFAVMAGGLVLASIAGLMIPSRLRPGGTDRFRQEVSKL
jgi:MFS family permease